MTLRMKRREEVNEREEGEEEEGEGEEAGNGGTDFVL